MRVEIERMVKPSFSDDQVFLYGNRDTGEHERHFYEAFLGLRNAATALAQAEQFHDAYLNLNFSIECFFKYVFCVVRREVMRSQHPDTFEKSIPPFYRRIFTRKQENMKAESFGHNLHLLLENLRDNSNLRGKVDFEALLKELKRDQGNWVSSRYQIRNNGIAKKTYIQREKLFTAVLQGSLSRLQ